MPQISLLLPLGELGRQLRPGKPQAWVAAGPHAGGAGQQWGQGPGPMEGTGQWGSMMRLARPKGHQFLKKYFTGYGSTENFYANFLIV